MKFCKWSIVNETIINSNDSYKTRVQDNGDKDEINEIL